MDLLLKVGSVKRAVAATATTNSNSADFENATEKQARWVTNDLGITGGAITLECWVKFESFNTGSQMDIVQQSDGGNKVRNFLAVTESGGNQSIIFRRSKNWVNGTTITYTNANMGTGVWIHIVGTYDGTDMRLYTASAGGTHTLRAGPTAASGNGATNGSDHFIIGAVDADEGGSVVTTAQARHLDGLLDEVRCWNVARTITQLDDNFENELVGNETNLVGYYTLDNTWNDETASAFHLASSEGSPVATSTDVPFTS